MTTLRSRAATFHCATEWPCHVGLGWSGRAAEAKQPRLRAGVGLDLQRRVVLPGDPQPPGQAHDAARAVGAALLARGFVLRRIPALPTFRPSGFSGTASNTPLLGVTIRYFQSSMIGDTQ